VSRNAAGIADDQLRRLAAVSSGAVEVLSGPEPYVAPDWTCFEISLDLRGVASTPDGIQLRPRERFLIAVPPHYPFVPPVVEVSHSRWAGTPHIQWARRLCLYLSPTLEWAPEDGMRGVLERLVQWLERAAVGGLDPAGQPPHPPVAYADAAGPFAVIRGNIGPLAHQVENDQSPMAPLMLVGWGSSTVAGRLDVEEWFATDEFARRYNDATLPRVVQDRPTAAACILLDAPIAFEYPTDFADLARGLVKAGVRHDALRALVMQVATVTSAHTPARAAGRKTPKPPLPSLPVFIGSPSRRVDGLSRQIHLVGFSLDMTGRDADTLLGGLREIEMSGSAEPASRLNLSWLRVHEERPEVTLRRDHDSPTAWLRGKRVLVLGCGALGAPVAEQCVRAGSVTVALVDSGQVTPGILVRQPYTDEDIGAFKATALGARLNRILRSAAAIAITEDGIAWLAAQPDPLPYDLIIDATANAGVRAAIETVRMRCRTDWPALITMLVGRAATIGLLTVSTPKATGGGHDVLRRVGIAARRPGSELNDVADEFFPHPPRTETFQPEPGCSEPTFTGGYADVTGLATMMILAALNALDRPEQFEPMTAIAVRSPRATDRLPGPSRPAASAAGWPNDLLQMDESNQYEVRLSAGAGAAIRAEARRRARLHIPRVETGGMLIGSIDDSVQCIYVDHACPPTPDSLLGEQHFEHGIEGAQDTVDHFRASTGDVSGFLGMWHTHPGGPASPSATDEAGMASIVVPVAGVPRALMLIVGGEDPRWAEWRDADGRPAIYARYIDSTTAAIAATTRARPPGKYIRAGRRDATAPASRDGFRWWRRLPIPSRRRRSK
jgi:integrative and conjugative element protein (TIGR02256 family)